MLNDDKDIDFVPEEEGENVAKQLKNLRDKLEACQKDKETNLAGWQRERADFVNYKKDENKRLIDAILLVKIDMLSEFLGVLDTFHLAEESPQWNNLPPDWQQGMKGIYNQFWSIFKEYGVEEIKVDSCFDPNFCEAVNIVKTSEKEKDGQIAKIVNRGYRMGDRILRPAKVAVFKFETD